MKYICIYIYIVPQIHTKTLVAQWLSCLVSNQEFWGTIIGVNALQVTLIIWLDVVVGCC